MAKKIVYTEKSYADIDRIIEFNNLRNQSKTYSQKFLVWIKKANITATKTPNNWDKNRSVRCISIDLG